MTSKCKTCGKPKKQHVQDIAGMPLMCSPFGSEKFQPSSEKCKCGHDEERHLPVMLDGACYNCKGDCEKFQAEDGMSVTVDLSYLEKQKKGLPEDEIPLEIVNPMRDMVRDGKDWKQKKGNGNLYNKKGKMQMLLELEQKKGCGNIIGKTKEGFRKFCGVHGLCPSCSNQSPFRSKVKSFPVSNGKDKPEDSSRNGTEPSSGTQTLSDIKEIIGIPIDEVIEVLEIYKRNKSSGRN